MRSRTMMSVMFELLGFCSNSLMAAIRVGVGIAGLVDVGGDQLSVCFQLFDSVDVAEERTPQYAFIMKFVPFIFFVVRCLVKHLLYSSNR